MPPRVAVLLASYNGQRWIADQVESILQQNQVDVDIWVSDDMSSDGTWDMLCNISNSDSRIHLLPRQQRFGSAGQNFYNLLLSVDASQYDYIAFSDQDDIWLPDKLIGAVTALEYRKVDGVSSNVVAFWNDGKARIIVKSQPQRRFDYVFEAAGPGCTYLFTRSLARDVSVLLKTEIPSAREVCLHDWLVYAICRGQGRRWHIGSEITVRYRQHDANFLGANIGIASWIARHRRVTSGWYMNEVCKVVQVCLKLRPEDAGLCYLNELLTGDGDYGSRIKLAAIARHMRRGVLDQHVLSLYFLTGMFWSGAKDSQGNNDE